MKLYPSDIFYTKFAKLYGRYILEHQAYLRAVDEFVLSHALKGASLVDVGAGTGVRGKRIATALGAARLVFIDNSDGMIRILNGIPGACVVNADISHNKFSHDEKYDVVLCLSNVLSHIPGKDRGVALKNLSSLMADGGSLYLDVHNRYNIAHYGLLSVARNVLKDICAFRARGDFTLKMKDSGEELATEVHIFNPFEIESMLKESGLTIVERKVIDYRTGKRRKTFWEGQLVYKLKKA